VVERFRDEIGDWRLCILTPFGARVHAPWALALAARIRESLGLDANAIWSDDGIAIHLPDADAAPPSDLVLIDPRRSRSWSSTKSATRRSSAHASARTPRGRC
jgi:ATP-dependent Lhr-like helicase